MRIIRRDPVSKAAFELWMKLAKKTEEKDVIKSEIERTRVILKRKQDKDASTEQND